MVAKITSAQFVAFASQPISQNAAAIWPKVFTQFEMISFYPMAPGQTVATAVGNGFNIELQIQAGRADILLTALTADDGPQSALPDFNMIVDAFREPYLALCEIAQTNRMACLATGQVQSASNDELLRSLKEETGLPLEDGMTDVVFQYNLRKQADTAPDYTYNRICRWMTAALSRVQFQISDGAIPIPQMLGEAIFVVTRHADINTVPGPIINPVARGALFREMALESSRIVSGGHGTH
jgi:hypothetical protein